MSSQNVLSLVDFLKIISATDSFAGGGAHWALEPREVTLKSQICEFENWLKFIMLNVKQHSG